MATETSPQALDGLSPPVPPEPLISIHSLWKVFGEKPERAMMPENLEKPKHELLSELGLVLALKDVSFNVNKGETFVVMGLSGSGKSTLVRCLIRLVESTAGEILIDGANVLQLSETELRQFRRGKIAMVFQHFGLLPHRDVLDNAAWGLEVEGVDRATRYAKTRAVLAMVGLQDWESSYPHELSGGMQQRVGLARALAVDPDILLMDEPFSGLDPLIRRNLQDELVRLQQELHKTIIFITHDLTEALKLGDKIAIMRDGVVVQIGSPEEIVLTPEDEYVGEFTQDVRLESILNTSSVMDQALAVIMDHQGPRVALHIMRSNDSPAVLVVNAQRKYQGMLNLEHAVAATKAGHTHIADYLDTTAPCAAPGTPLDELIQMGLAATHVVPVIDENGLLVGEVRRSTLAVRIGATRDVGEAQKGHSPSENTGTSVEIPPALDQVAHEAIEMALAGSESP
jgi:glycine betaine/proline transport system ATP-binding protein